MFFKTKKTDKIDTESREQYEYARRRIIQKKNLMRHFVFFLAGAVLFIVLDAFLKKGHEILGNGWFVWGIMIWGFILLVHVFNVFIMNKFMGKEWEDRQLELLKAKQKKRIDELKKQALTEVTVDEVVSAREIVDEAFPDSKNALASKKNDHPNQLPE